MHGEWTTNLETDDDDDDDDGYDNDNDSDNNNDDDMTTIVMLACTNMSFCFYQIFQDHNLIRHKFRTHKSTAKFRFAVLQTEAADDIAVQTTSWLGRRGYSREDSI